MKRAEVPSVVLGPVGEVTLHPEVYAPILDALATGSKSIAQLASEPSMAALGVERLRQALTVLVGMEAVAPCVGPANEPGRIARIRTFNALSLERAQRKGPAPGSPRRSPAAAWPSPACYSRSCTRTSWDGRTSPNMSGSS